MPRQNSDRMSVHLRKNRRWSLIMRLLLSLDSFIASILLVFFRRKGGPFKRNPLYAPILFSISSSNDGTLLESLLPVRVSCNQRVGFTRCNWALTSNPVALYLHHLHRVGRSLGFITELLLRSPSMCLFRQPCQSELASGQGAASPISSSAVDSYTALLRADGSLT